MARTAPYRFARVSKVAGHTLPAMVCSLGLLLACGGDDLGSDGSGGLPSAAGSSPSGSSQGTTGGGQGGAATAGDSSTPAAGTGGTASDAGASANTSADASGSSSGGTSDAGGSSAGDAGGSSAGDAGGTVKSGGCGQMPTLKNSTSNSDPSAITISVAGTNREYAIRWPSNYDNTHPYRLILNLHGYGGSYKETAGHDYFGLWTPSNNTTIFIALSAIRTDWRTGDNLAYVDAVLKAVEADLCIDTSRIMLEGFSQGAAVVWQLACSRPGVFRAAAGHSGGGVTNPTSCMPIPYLGSGGLMEQPPATQRTQTDQFAKWNGCMVTELPKPATGVHTCTNYTGCPAVYPVRWCNFDGRHVPLPMDSGQNTSWLPSETWPFFSQF